MDQIFKLASDVLLGAGALGAAIYCVVLARRLKRFNNLENGVGGAVAVLSAQVDDMTRTLDQARKAAAHSAQSLTSLTDRAESSARKLELMMASLHDLPEATSRLEEEIENSAGSDEDRASQETPRPLAGATPEPPPLFASRRTAAMGAQP
ncbi:hypothetical protein [Maritimibacter sp. HL-12]|uniref:hypothetical protein n=1 Tax=Maritimibacter sp. HL-12 TaxID=1162418 RepID=UPI000A0EFC2F|nr:hypothetical protein [Maritimibacter sp. HL-12]SMH43054.1 hypothetical protein SAMN05661107_1384 [Maritimibacter sp. HL-12]